MDETTIDSPGIMVAVQRPQGNRQERLCRSLQIYHMSSIIATFGAEKLVPVSPGDEQTAIEVVKGQNRAF